MSQKRTTAMIAQFVVLGTVGAIMLAWLWLLGKGLIWMFAMA